MPAWKKNWYKFQFEDKRNVRKESYYKVHRVKFESKWLKFESHNPEILRINI